VRPPKRAKAQARQQAGGSLPGGVGREQPSRMDSQIPEIDRVAYFALGEAIMRIRPSQLPCFVKRAPGLATQHLRTSRGS
jgi:predicted NUDIX family NTP pyrophosphohydrolase